MRADRALRGTWVKLAAGGDILNNSSNLRCINLLEIISLRISSIAVTLLVITLLEMISLKINSCDSSAYSTRFVETNLLDGLGHLSLAQLSLFLSFQSKSEFLNKKNKIKLL